MDKVALSVQESIKSGEYFKDGLDWYNREYLYCIVQRSISFSFLLSMLLISLIVGLFLSKLLPLSRREMYIVHSSGFKTAKITNANEIKDDSISSVAKILLEKYVVARESYNYEKLKNQFLYIQNSSTRISFKQFTNSMSLSNKNSFVIKYQKELIRNVEIISLEFKPNNNAEITFSSHVIDNKEVLENKIWIAKVNFEIDPINIDLPTGNKFNFIVTDYKTLLIKDNINQTIQK